MSRSRAAAKQFRYRERQREPVKLVLKVEAEWARTVEALIRERLIDAHDAFRKETVEMAIGHLLEQWTDRVLR